MKLVLAMVQASDARRLLDALMAGGYRATRVSTVGGFLVRGNATILIGVQDEQVEAVLGILRQHGHPRRQFVSPVVPISDPVGARGRLHPVQVDVGGMTAFVLDIERSERL
jgi:uncharacterized protein YaaQ